MGYKSDVCAVKNQKCGTAHMEDLFIQYKSEQIRL